MGSLQALAAEFAITLADGSVWLSIGQGLLFAAICLLLGIGLARFVGLLEIDAPAGETLGVGLASGLLALAAGWAAVASGGRSSFTPVAVGFTMAIALAVIRSRQLAADPEPPTTEPSDIPAETLIARSARRRNLIVGILGGAAFVVAVALLYGSTLRLSPRDGVQPLEFMDEAYYSVLGADVAKTGSETIYSPSGFEAIEGLPPQTWYHWGELWLAAAVISVFGMAPLDARHLVVLPIMLLASAALTGTVVRRTTRSASRGAFLFGFLACLFLAPMPLIPGPFFSSFARGLIFEIRMYGLAAVAVLLALYSIAVLGRRQASWTLAIFVGSAAAMIVPAHIVIALLALVGVGSVVTIRIGQSLVVKRQLPVLSPVWQRTFIVAVIAMFATVVWGLLTGHGIAGTGLSPSVSPFNGSWRESVAITAVCSGAFLAIVCAWFLVRKETLLEADLYFGTAALLVTGTLVWGARLGDFDTVHLFLAGIAVFGAPAAAVAVASIWLRLRAGGHRGMAIALVVLCSTQLELGVAASVLRLQGFGPGTYQPIPTEIVAAIQRLSSDAKLAYACRPSEEASFWAARLVALDAHTGRRIVPLCFQAETLGLMTGTPMSADIASPLFRWAPQATLYPNSGAQPSEASIAEFLKANGIGYIYVDALHPDSLVPGAVPIATSGATQVLRLP